MTQLLVPLAAGDNRALTITLFLAAEATDTTARTLTITLFLIFVAVTLGITIWASRQTKSATDFYARHAKKSLDPLASELRDEFEQETGR